MGTNGVILINLENRNAAEFESILVPGSYEKALGAATAGTYVTVYKWLYNGFAMTASLCTAENKTEYISLVDKTNGGELKVYDDDTITLVGAVAPEPPEPPTPVTKNFKAYHITSGSTTSPYSLMLQKGHFVGTEFSTDWNPEDMILDGEPIEVTQSMCSGVETPYLLEGCATIAYVGGWIVRAPEFAHEWMANSYWVYYWPNTLLHQWENTATEINKYFCEDGGTTIPDVRLVGLSVTENGEYDPSDYNADGFALVSVEVSGGGGGTYSEEVQEYIDTISTVPMYNGGYEYAGYLYGTQLATDLDLTLLADASQGSDSVQLSDSIANYSGVILQGVYRGSRTSTYNTSILYLNPITLNQQYWAGMKDRNSSYTCNVTFTSNTEATLSGNKQVLIYGIP